MTESVVTDAMIFRSNLGARIGFCVDKIGKKGEAAASVRVTPEQLNKWIKGTVKVPVEALRELSITSGVDFSWLATGQGVRPQGAPVQMQRSVTAAEEKGLSETSDQGMIRLPVYREVRAAAGPGASPVSERVDSMISLGTRFLRDQGAVPERCSVIWAHGDSMMPTIPDGSALIVDRSQIEVKNGSIMVIGVGDDLLVKRIRRLDGLIDLISDNQAYAPETLGPDTLQQLRVIGRVVYFCRTP